MFFPKEDNTAESKGCRLDGKDFERFEDWGTYVLENNKIVLLIQRWVSLKYKCYETKHCAHLYMHDDTETGRTKRRENEGK